MSLFHSLTDLINTLQKGRDLLTEMFEKRNQLDYKYDDALEVMKDREETVQLLIARRILIKQHSLLAMDERYLGFFEDVLEVGETVNNTYIQESIRQIKQEYIIYYLQSKTPQERFKYLRAVKSALTRIGRTVVKNIVDLNRNIDHAFKKEPNYQIKLSKLENYRQKLEDLEQLIVHTERLLSEEERTFFNTATDGELGQITMNLEIELFAARQHLIETRRQIIAYINQTQYQAVFIEKLAKLKHLRDQYEIKHKTDILDILANERAVMFEPRPSYPLKLSLERLQQDDMYPVIKKANQKHRAGGRAPKRAVAPGLATVELDPAQEELAALDLYGLKKGFTASGQDLLGYIAGTSPLKDAGFPEQLHAYCQLIALFGDEMSFTEEYGREGAIEYAIVHYNKANSL